jgi:hypothetical protein
MKMEATCSSETLGDFTELHSIMSQEVEVFNVEIAWSFTSTQIVLIA